MDEKNYPTIRMHDNRSILKQPRSQPLIVISYKILFFYFAFLNEVDYKANAFPNESHDETEHSIL